MHNEQSPRQPITIIPTLKEASRLDLGLISIKNIINNKPTNNIGVVEASISLQDPLPLGGP